MSDMRHVYNAYSAIYNPEIKKKLEESRDAFSKMNLNQLNDQDLYEVSEEILEKVFFHYDLDVPTAESLIESVLSDAIAGDKSPLRADKIERLTEAFASAFARVKEKSIRVAKESYTEYLYKKDQLSRLSNNNDLDLPRKKLHDSLVAEDKSVVKNGLLEIIEKKVAKPDYLDFDKDGDKKESMKKALKDKKMSEAYTVTNADKKGNTPAYQAYKAGKKNVKTGEPLYKAADHLKKEELETSGVFSEQEIANILWVEFDESREYSHNPEKYHDSEGHDKKLERDKPYHKRSRAARMADPERGINSPAFKKFMADRGM